MRSANRPAAAGSRRSGGEETVGVDGPAATRPSRPAHATENAEPSHPTRLTRRIIQAAHELDPDGLQARLDVAEATLGLAACLDQIALPVRQPRLTDPTGQRQTIREVMTTEAIRAWLHLRGSQAPPPRDVGPILLACGPRDPDPIGPESLALLLRFQRWPCRVLGPRTSPLTLTIAARASDAIAVAVFSTDSRGRCLAVDSLRAVHTNGYPVFYAGSTFQTPRSRRHLPGHYLGTSLQNACTLLTDTLTSARQPQDISSGPGPTTVDRVTPNSD